MEIDGGQQQQGVDAAVPDGFNTDYLRIYYGKCLSRFSIPFIMCGTDGGQMKLKLEADLYPFYRLCYKIKNKVWCKFPRKGLVLQHIF